MNAISEYIISIVSVAIIISIATMIIKNNGTISVIIKLISGLILAITIIRPILNNSLHISQYFEDIQTDADIWVEEGLSDSRNKHQVIIKDNLEAYIYNKAADMGIRADFEISLSDEYPPTPVSVTVSGAVSPYNKNILMQFLEQEIGIPKENQRWN